MATNKKLLNDLLTKLNVTPQRLSQKRQEVKRLYGPMSTEEATYFIAHQEGLDLTKYLEPDLVDRIRGLVPKPSIGSAPTSTARPKKAKSARTTPIRITPNSEPVDALLSASIARDSKMMATIYPTFYVLENSLRLVIKRILEERHGKEWWSDCVPSDVQNRVNGRKKDERSKPWHGKRGAHEIFYSDFKDLRSILEKNWADFAELFPSRPWITQKLDELEAPRNIIAHNNPLNTVDQQRIELYFHDWIELLKDRRELIS